MTYNQIDRQIANVRALVEFRMQAELNETDIPIATKCQLLEERAALARLGVIYIPVSFMGLNWLFNVETNKVEQVHTEPFRTNRLTKMQILAKLE